MIKKMETQQQYAQLSHRNIHKSQNMNKNKDKPNKNASIINRRNLSSRHRIKTQQNQIKNVFKHHDNNLDKDINKNKQLAIFFKQTVAQSISTLSQYRQRHRHKKAMSGQLSQRYKSINSQRSHKGELTAHRSIQFLINVNNQNKRKIKYSNGDNGRDIKTIDQAKLSKCNRRYFLGKSVENLGDISCTNQGIDKLCNNKNKDKKNAAETRTKSRRALVNIISSARESNHNQIHKNTQSNEYKQISSARCYPTQNKARRYLTEQAQPHNYNQQQNSDFQYQKNSHNNNQGRQTIFQKQKQNIYNNICTTQQKQLLEISQIIGENNNRLSNQTSVLENIGEIDTLLSGFNDNKNIQEYRYMNKRHIENKFNKRYKSIETQPNILYELKQNNVSMINQSNIQQDINKNDLNTLKNLHMQHTNIKTKKKPAQYPKQLKQFRNKTLIMRSIDKIKHIFPKHFFDRVLASSTSTIIQTNQLISNIQDSRNNNNNHVF